MCNAFVSRTKRQAAFILAVVAAVQAAPNGVLAQEPAKYEVSGFRDARFGMTEQEVRASVVKTLGVKPADIVSSANPIEGTTVLTIKVALLDPVPGPAQVAYILGYGSKKLIQVNVIWGDA